MLGSGKRGELIMGMSFLWQDVEGKASYGVFWSFFWISETCLWKKLESAPHFEDKAPRPTIPSPVETKRHSKQRLRREKVCMQS